MSRVLARSKAAQQGEPTISSSGTGLSPRFHLSRSMKPSALDACRFSRLMRNSASAPGICFASVAYSCIFCRLTETPSSGFALIQHDSSKSSSPSSSA